MEENRRRMYIINLAVLISLGYDDPTTTNEEYIEAIYFLESIGIKIPEMVLTMAAN